MVLERYVGNPILAPTRNAWESAAVCNPAAVAHDGRVHIVYRAIDRKGVSRLGHAVSDDGFRVAHRAPVPLLSPLPDCFEERVGVEDPRLTPLGGRHYITFTAASIYDDGRPPRPWDLGTPWRVRVALAVTDDFQRVERIGIVIPDRDSKNAVLFPEEIGGRFAMFHRPYPEIWIAWSDDLRRWHGHRRVMGPRAGSWDSDRIGAGAPPIRIPEGWLMIYHGTRVADGHRIYQLGVALFDADDPSRVIARSPRPILEPEADCERQGLVRNVVFACGLVERGDQYLVYYGGADQVVCVATTTRARLLSSLEPV
ncbi:MAG: glycosidase [Armatimonadetes bacterium]|nr:glycosidase [Armatimonadota bacterium]